LRTLRAYEARTDYDSYTIVLTKGFSIFGAAIHESLTRTLGQYLEVTGGGLATKHKTEWEKDIAARMLGTNNAAETPFATVRALLHIYPRSRPFLIPQKKPILTLTIPHHYLQQLEIENCGLASGGHC
jgi:hypothetical protein